MTFTVWVLMSGKSIELAFLERGFNKFCDGESENARMSFDPVS